MEMEDHDFQVVRKNLNILSVLILILAYTNAHLGSFSFLGIILELDGSKLYQAFYLAYVYFIWRFLTKLPLKTGFWNDFLQYYITSDEGVKKKYTFERYKSAFISNSDRLKEAIENSDPYYRYLQMNVVRLANWPLTKLRLSAIFSATGREGKNDSAQFSAEYDVNLSWFFVTRKLVLFCVKYDKFGDYLFPLIPVISVLCFFFFKAEWQGSLISFLKLSGT